MSDAKIGLVVTPEHRAAFVQLFEAKAFVDPKTKKPKGEPKYGYLALFANATDISELKAVAIKVAKAKFGDSVDLKTVKFPFKNGDKEAERIVTKAAKNGKEKKDSDVAFYRGNVVMKVSSNFEPKVVDNQGNDLLDKAAIYSGVYVRAEFNFRAQLIEASEEEGGDKRYVSAYVNFVMKTKDGERLSGKSAKEVFKGLLGGSSTADPTDDAGSDII